MKNLDYDPARVTDSDDDLAGADGFIWNAALCVAVFLGLYLAIRAFCG